MTQYSTNFSEYALDAQPSDWTRRFIADFGWTVVADASGTGGKVLRGLAEAASSRNGLSWDALDADPLRADCETCIRFRFPGPVTSAELAAMTRGSGTSSTASLYRHGPRPYLNAVALARYLNGSFSGFGGAPSPAAADDMVGNFYTILIRTRGTTHALKTWADGEDEAPGFWDGYELDPLDGANTFWEGTATDTSVSGVGWVGLFRFRADPVDIDFFSVGTGTDNAPLPGLTSNPVLAAVIADNVGASGYAASVETTGVDGTLYHVVTTSAAPPSAAQIQAGEDELGAAADAFDNQTVTTTGEQTVSGTGLTEAETYYVHFYHVDSVGGSNIITSASFIPVDDVPSAPSLTSPSAAADGPTGYTGSVVTDSAAGDLYYAVTDDPTAPSPAQIVIGDDHNDAPAASSGSQVIDAAGTKAVAGTGLTEGTVYYIHFYHEDANGGSAVTSSSGFSYQVTVPVPTNPSVADITDISATLNWEAGG